MSANNLSIKLTSEAKKQLRDLGVVALYLFGSRAQGTEGLLSDYDFAVLLKEVGHKRGNALYDKLYDLLSPGCPRMLDNDVIDIVFLRDVSLELQFHVIRYGQVLFDTDSRVRVKFEEQTTLKYCDFKPLLNMFDQAVLEAI